MLKKFSFLILLTFLLTGSAFGQNNLAVCQGTDSVQWSNCFGIYTFPNGEKYIGDFKDGQFNGQGTLKLSSGNKYVGEFKDNLFHGEGAYFKADGSMGLGEWVAGKPSGRFIVYRADKTIEESGVFRDGNVVRSQYVDPKSFANISKFNPALKVNELQQIEGKIIIKEFQAALSRAQSSQSRLPGCTGIDTNRWTNCFGTKRNADNSRYVGEFKDGKSSGQGTAFNSNGGYFVGDFKNDYPDGQGTFLLPYGNYFFGEYTFGSPSGKGVVLLADGSVKESGLYANGKLVTPQYINLQQMAVDKRMKEVEDKRQEELEREGARIRELERQRLAEEKLIREAKAAEERRIQEAKEAEERRTQEAKAAEEKRIQDAKAAEERRIQEAKEAEERRIQEAKDAKEAEERRIWLTTPAGKKFAAAEAAKAKKEEADRQRAAAIEEARVKKEESERQKALIAERARIEKEELERQKVAQANAPNLNTNQDKALFMGKCYAMAIVLTKSDPEATPSEIDRVRKWAMKVSGAAQSFTTDQEFNKISITELKSLYERGRSYIFSQMKICTKVLGAF